MNEGPGIPKGSGNVRMLAYLALLGNDQLSAKGRMCRMRHVFVHVACLLFRVFCQALGRASNRT